MLKDVVEARPLGGHRLYLRFEDGVEGEVDVAAMVRFTGVFAPLADEAEFARVRVDPELGTVVWPGGADLDRDVLYAAATGESIRVAETPTVAPRDAEHPASKPPYGDRAAGGVTWPPA